MERKVSITRGAVAFYSLSDGTLRESLVDAFTALGLEAYIPEERTKEAALRAALQTLYADQHTDSNIRTLIRPLGSKVKGYSVTDESVEDGGKNLVYKVRGRAWFEDGNLETSGFATDDVTEDRARVVIRAEYLAAKAGVASHSLSRSLVRIIQRVCRGVSLRETGGVYYVPQGKLDLLKDVAKAVEGAGDNTMYFVHSKIDADAVKAVSAAVRNDVASSVHAIEQEVLKGDLHKRALENRQLRCAVLLERLAFYESELGVTFDEIRKGVETTEQVTVMAALQNFGG